MLKAKNKKTPLHQVEWKSRDMTYYEGILATKGVWHNFAAIGAEIVESKIGGKVYLPSDTADRLEEGKRFTFSLADEPELFFKAALTGNNRSDYCELKTSGYEVDGEFVYPKRATKIYFCKIKKTKLIEQEDEYGEAEIKLFEAEIIRKEGELEYISREEPHVDAMVHASRFNIADKEQKKKIQNQVESILSDVQTDLKKKILEYIQG